MKSRRIVFYSTGTVKDRPWAEKVNILTLRRGRYSRDFLFEQGSESYYLDYAAEDDAVDGMGQRQGTLALRHFNRRKGSKRGSKWPANYWHWNCDLTNCNCLRCRCPIEAVQPCAPAGPSYPVRNKRTRRTQHGGLIVLKLGIPNDAVALNIKTDIYYSGEVCEAAA